MLSQLFPLITLTVNRDNVNINPVSLISVKKCQEVTRSDKKCQEASRTYFGVVLSFKRYILTNYDIRKVSDIIV